MEKITLEPATTADAAEMLAIYAPYVQYTTVSSEYDPPTLAEFERRIRTYTETLPWLICRVDGVAAGYGYASPHRTRAGYQWSVETSIYVRKDFHRRGIAAAIYRALFDLLREQGYYNIFVGVTSPNVDSIRFHTAMGFVRSGAYQNSMYKFGQWHDVHWMHKSLREHLPAPAPTTPFPQIAAGERVRAILREQAAAIRPAGKKEKEARA